MKNLPATLEGGKVADRLKRTLAEMLDATAQVEAKRHGATAVDAPDYTAAFESIVASPRRQIAKNNGLDLIALLAASLISYSVNLMTGSGDRAAIALSLIGGVPLAGIAIFFKYLRG